MTDLEVHNLPLVARNPYNFALVQPGVTGIENVEFGVPRLAANGAAMRINYQIDGNTNTEKDRAGLRLLPMSEVMIQEVKVVTTGFAPEFGQTMGMVYNAVTPSGTNTFRGDARLPVPPQGVQRVSVLLRLHRRGVDLRTASGGRCATGHEGRHRHRRRRRADREEQGVLLRRLGTDAPRSVVEQPDHRSPGDRGRARPQAAAGVRAERPDGEVLHREVRSADERRRTAPTVRWIRFANDAPYNSGGNLNTLEWATDFLDAMDSVAGQVVTTLGSSKLNELRMQYAHRHQQSVRERRLRHRPGGHDHRRRQLRQPAERHRAGQRRLRLQAEHHAGDRQLHLHPRGAQLQVRLRLPAHPRRARRRRRSSSTRSRRSRRIWRRRPARARSAIRR